MCTTGWIRRGKSDANVRIFAFPKDKGLRKKWVEAVKRHKKWGMENAKTPKLCSRHFRPEDLTTYSRSKRKHLAGRRLKRICLVTGAVPSIFEEWPSSSQNTGLPGTTPRRTINSLTAGEPDPPDDPLDVSVFGVPEKNRVRSFQELKEKLHQVEVPERMMQLIVGETKLHYISFSTEGETGVAVLA